jgi:hypothetical protein
MAAIFGQTFQWSVTTPITNLGVWQVLVTLPGLQEFNKAVGTANLIGATGGTLDVCIQTNYGGSGLVGPTAGYWKDIARFTQLAAGGAAATYGFVLTRGIGGTLNAPTTENTTDATPTLAVNTIVPQALGDAIRLIVLPQAGTTAGAALTFSFDCSP